MLDVMIYVVIFIMGTVFGSFFTLAIYRLPRKENITYVRSHCTTCNHNLNFWDLIPVWSYLFLGGKCRYCKSKIRSRYILLEIFSGLAFMLIAYTLKISAYSTLLEFINLFFIYLFFCAIYIIGGIDKETLKIHNFSRDMLHLRSRQQYIHTVRQNPASGQTRNNKSLPLYILRAYCPHHAYGEENLPNCPVWHNTLQRWAPLH